MIRDEDMDGFLSPLSVGRLGGPRTAKKLAERGIRTAGDLRGTDASLIYSWFWSIQGARLWGLTRGVDNSPVVPAREAKSISQEVTYHEDLLREDTVVRELRRLAALVSARLVAENLLGSTVRIKIRWSDFTTRTRQVRLPEPTDHPGIIADEAVALLLLGVGVAGLIAATFRPGRLFIPDGPPPSPQQDSGPLLLS